MDHDGALTHGDDTGPQTREMVYTVRKGDNIWTISRRYGVKVSKIFQWNNLNANSRIHPGDKLRLIVNAEI